MKTRSTVTALLLGATLLAPLGASAQTSVYEEPKVKLGKGDPSVSNSGKGTVVVQVFVKADGSAKVQRVIRSTNPGDNEAAIAIAKSSTYTAATRQGKAVDAFKDFTIVFTSSGAATPSGGPAPAGGLAQADAMLHAGNYAGAKSAATSYLGAHPDSTEAYAVLGASNAFLNDNTAAAAAFDKAGKIPEKYVPVAVQAYIGAANSLGQASKTAEAVAAAKKAVALQPGLSSYNALGVQELAANDSAGAVRDLEQANKLAAADAKAPANVRATILSNLSSAYAVNGQMDKAKTTVADAQKFDPKAKAGDGVANVLVQQAEALQTQKKNVEAGAMFADAADFSPANASALYLRAAVSYLNAQPKPEPDKARDAANKSLAADPNNANSQFALGVALAELGKKDDARNALQKALAAARATNQTGLADKTQEALKQLDSSGKNQ